jgi:hypothetical protein
MARSTTPRKRGISLLDAIIVIGGVLLIVVFNRMSISKLQRSLPNVNSQIVGEWKATRGSERLIFRPDKTISVIDPSPAGAPAPASPPLVQTPNAAEPAAPAAAPAAPAEQSGKYQLASTGSVYIQLDNGKKYVTTLKPETPNRFDLIDNATQGVSTFERVP